MESDDERHPNFHADFTEVQLTSLISGLRGEKILDGSCVQSSGQIDRI